MAEVSVSVEEPWIRVVIAGAKDEPMMEDVRQAQATRAAKKHTGHGVSLISSGGAFNRGDWELHYSYVPAGYKFPRRTD